MKLSALGFRLFAVALLGAASRTAFAQAESRELRAESRSQAQSREPRAQSPLDVRFGVTRSHDTVTVGQPFTIQVRVRAPLGSTIHFPDNPDTAGAIQARDPRVVMTTDSVQSLDQTATYRVAAWDVPAAFFTRTVTE